MLTVVIGQKEHLEQIKEYNYILAPLLKNKDIALCEWKPERTTLMSSVPELMKTISGHSRWRVVILADERGLYQINPFDRVKLILPEKGEDEDNGSYQKRIRPIKHEAYERAAKEPLVRLTTYLSKFHVVDENAGKDIQDPIFQAYFADDLYKQKLRNEIQLGKQREFRLPEEIHCIALRTYNKDRYDLLTAWNVEHRYKEFWDSNLYPDTLRYMVFDILNEKHQDYEYDYLRFVSTVLLFAAQEVPQGSLEANRVYRIDGECDYDTLKKMVLGYDDKLAATSESLQKKIDVIRTTPHRHLTDSEVESLFCSQIGIPVIISDQFNDQALLADHKFPRLSTDCPVDEHATWGGMYSDIEKAFHRYLKLPRRSLKTATEDMRNLNRVTLDTVQLATEIQLDDIRNFIANNEERMVEVPTGDIEKEEVYLSQMKEADQEVTRSIDTRMTRLVTVVAGLLVLVTVIATFLPFLLEIINSGTAEDISLTVFLGILLVVLVFLTGMVGLRHLRKLLVNRLKHFNYVMYGIMGEVNTTLDNYSMYLTYACSMMRGYSALELLQDCEKTDQRKIMVLTKHLEDQKSIRLRLRESFGSMINEELCPGKEDGEIYDYNYGRKIDYEYPMPFPLRASRKIEFLQMENFIEIPIPYVSKVSLRQEELYD